MVQNWFKTNIEINHKGDMHLNPFLYFGAYGVLYTYRMFRNGTKECTIK